MRSSDCRSGRTSAAKAAKDRCSMSEALYQAQTTAGTVPTVDDAAAIIKSQYRDGGSGDETQVTPAKIENPLAGDPGVVVQPEGQAAIEAQAGKCRDIFNYVV